MEGFVDTGQEGAGGMCGEIMIDIKTTYEIDSCGNLLHSTGSSAWCSVMAKRGRAEGGGREVQEGGCICVHIADSLHCTAETNAPW